MFRWCGPVRVINVFGHDSKSNVTVVETYPGQERVVRHVHVSRLRPYTTRIPLDSAERAAEEAKDDFATELRNWEQARILKRKPRGLQPTDTGISLQLLKMFDPTFSEEDISNPEMRIEKLKKHWFNGEKYQYFTKWLGWSARYNTWQDEADLHPELVSDYWDDLRDSHSKEFKHHRNWLRSQKSKQRQAEQAVMPPQFENTPIRDINKDIPTHRYSTRSKGKVPTDETSIAVVNIENKVTDILMTFPTSRLKLFLTGQLKYECKRFKMPDNVERIWIYNTLTKSVTHVATVEKIVTRDEAVILLPQNMNENIYGQDCKFGFMIKDIRDLARPLCVDVLRRYSISVPRTFQVLPDTFVSSYLPTVIE
ncbi:hypothetical protein HDU76_009986 [Blyttiomyces sp. JEL0837]|nr:hypothetical protein HDU76_009986 [Blyttiomyces sp. JEL0837]